MSTSRQLARKVNACPVVSASNPFELPRLLHIFTQSGAFMNVSDLIRMAIEEEEKREVEESNSSTGNCNALHLILICIHYKFSPKLDLLHTDDMNFDSILKIRHRH